MYTGESFSRSLCKEENNADTENKTENLSEEKQFWQVQTRTQSKAKQMKLRDLNKEKKRRRS